MATNSEAGDLALRVAAAVLRRSAPTSGRPSARTRVGVAPGGDATLAVDEVAEEVVEHVLRSVGDVGFYSEDRGLVVFGRPRWFLVVDPVDGTRPAAAGLESCAVSIGVTPPREDATLGDVEFGVVHELKTGDVYWAERGRGAAAMRVDGTPIPLVPSTNCRPVGVVLDRGAPRSSEPADGGRARRAGRRVQHGRRHVRARARPRSRSPGWPTASSTPTSTWAGEPSTPTRPSSRPSWPWARAPCAPTSRTTSPAGALILHELGAVCTRADGGSLAPHPAVGSGRAYGLDVLAAGTPALHAGGPDRARPGHRRPRRLARPPGSLSRPRGAHGVRATPVPSRRGHRDRHRRHRRPARPVPGRGLQRAGQGAEPGRQRLRHRSRSSRSAATTSSRTWSRRSRATPRTSARRSRRSPRPAPTPSTPSRAATWPSRRRRRTS